MLSAVLQTKSGSCIVVLMDRWPILVFSSYILVGWIMLHLLMCISFIGRVANTGLHLMLLLYASWCSVVLQDNWPRLACVQ